MDFYTCRYNLNINVKNNYNCQQNISHYDLIDEILYYVSTMEKSSIFKNTMHY